MSGTGERPVGAEVLGDLDEEQILARVLALLPRTSDAVRVGPGDDAAALAVPSGGVLATTDTMVRGHDWRDEWSSGHDVGAKLVAQNLADLAAMGGVGTGVLLTLAADPATALAWAQAFAEGVALRCRQAGVPVLGGDLSAAAQGSVMVSITALGQAPGPVVLRSNAAVGDQVAVCGTLGRSAAGWLLLREGRPDQDRELVQVHRRPWPPLEHGPIAARHGATAMIDLSDGLVRDAGRIAAASGVCLELDTTLMGADLARLAQVVPPDQAHELVLTGGEEHSLLACFGADVRLPPPWRRIGRVSPGAGVVVDGGPQAGGGWDHFAGRRGQDA